MKERYGCKVDYEKAEKVDYGKVPFLLTPVYAEKKGEDGRRPFIGYIKRTFN